MKQLNDLIQQLDPSKKQHQVDETSEELKLPDGCTIKASSD